MFDVIIIKLYTFEQYQLKVNEDETDKSDPHEREYTTNNENISSLLTTND
ncbi:MAG TPA: hypothetical protein V6D14_13905 [Coleofasciculaceae cyanobacterium]